MFLRSKGHTPKSHTHLLEGGTKSLLLLLQFKLLMMTQMHFTWFDWTHRALSNHIKYICVSIDTLNCRGGAKVVCLLVVSRGCATVLFIGKLQYTMLFYIIWHHFEADGMVYLSFKYRPFVDDSCKDYLRVSILNVSERAIIFKETVLPKSPTKFCRFFYGFFQHVNSFGSFLTFIEPFGGSGTNLFRIFFSESEK